MGISSLLPKPKQSSSKWDDNSDEEAPQEPLKHLKSTGPPPYGKRSSFVPKSLQDYADGGAFPEIRIVQYPLDMGRTRSKSNAIALSTDAAGNIKYDMILHNNARDGTVIHSTLKDITEQDITEDGEDPFYTQEKIDATAEKTRQALEKIVDGKLKASQPKQVYGNVDASGPTYVRYTPQTSSASAPGQSRIIKMVTVPVDPMAPPKHRHRKIPRGPPSPPPPVLHSPPRKVTVEEQKDWVIPPCISNWKNAKGYTIPLDKRLAADGRGVQEVTINDNFAKLSEALFIADRHARDEVKIRAEMQGKLATKEKKDKEEKLRSLAQMAREERSGITSAASLGANTSHNQQKPSSDEESSEEEMDEDEKRKLRERDQIRKDRQKQHERELRLNNMGAETKQKVLSKSGDRDISEKIALGISQPKLSKESMFDQRLFNQTEGIASGFSGEDTYGIYDKPLFNGSSANAIYRPKKAESADAVYGDSGVRSDAFDKILGEKGGPHKGFSGAEAGESGVTRDGPVLFEKEEAHDPFGLEQFMTSGKRDRNDDKTKDRGSMAASASGARDDYSTKKGSDSRKIDFSEEGSSKRRRK